MPDHIDKAVILGAIMLATKKRGRFATSSIKCVAIDFATTDGIIFIYLRVL